MKESKRTKFSQRTMPLIVVALLGIFFSVAAFMMVRDKELERIRGDFQLAAKNLASDLQRTLENDLDALPLVRALFHGSEFVTREEFGEFVTPILNRNPHIVSLGWIQAVNHEQWPDFVRAMERDGGFDANHLERKESPISEHFPVCYLEGEVVSEIAKGKDLALMPKIFGALKIAGDQGRVTSIPFAVGEEQEKNSISYLFFLPVYGKNLFSGKSSGSEQALGGFVFGYFPLKQVLEQVLDRYRDDGVTAILFDRSQSEQTTSAPNQEDEERRKFISSEIISLFDLDLVLRAHTQPGFIARRMSWHPHATLAAGLFLTALLFTFLVNTFHRSSQVELLAEKLSAEVAERKRVAEAREKLVRELEAKNAELERFTYTVSHDLKSPLITIRGFTGLLAKDAEKGDFPRINSDVDQIKRATDKMQQLLDELLELSRIGRLVNPFRSIPLPELVGEVLEMLAGRIAKGRVEVAVQPEMPTVFGDRPRLLEVFQNLIDNAVKFMGGQTAPRIEIGAELRGKEAVCSIRDNGIGIHPRYQSKVFGLFERLDQTLEGTGIGLALVHRIISFHGGRIWIDSEGEGKGSTFIFTLPLEMKKDTANED